MWTAFIYCLDPETRDAAKCFPAHFKCICSVTLQRGLIFLKNQAHRCCQKAGGSAFPEANTSDLEVLSETPQHHRQKVSSPWRQSLAPWVHLHVIQQRTPLKAAGFAGWRHVVHIWLLQLVNLPQLLPSPAHCEQTKYQTSAETLLMSCRSFVVSCTWTTTVWELLDSSSFSNFTLKCCKYAFCNM